MQESFEHEKETLKQSFEEQAGKLKEAMEAASEEQKRELSAQLETLRLEHDTMQKRMEVENSQIKQRHMAELTKQQDDIKRLQREEAEISLELLQLMLCQTHDGRPRPLRYEPYESCKKVPRAAYNGDLRYLVELLDAGRDPNQVTKNGISALDHARRNDDDWMIQFLLQRGARDVDWRSKL